MPRNGLYSHAHRLHGRATPVHAARLSCRASRARRISCGASRARRLCCMRVTCPPRFVLRVASPFVPCVACPSNIVRRVACSLPLLHACHVTAAFPAARRVAFRAAPRVPIAFVHVYHESVVFVHVTHVTAAFRAARGVGFRAARRVPVVFVACVSRDRRVSYCASPFVRRLACP